MSIATTSGESETADPVFDEPLMRNGDRLTQPEFHRLYQQMPGVRAELIGGVVYIEEGSSTAFPVSRPHAEFHSLAAGWSGVYAARVPWLTSLSDATFIASRDDEVQPDVALVVDPTAGGRSAVGKRRCQEGVGELFVEVAYSSISRDLNAKLDLYRREGVGEYVVLDVQSESVHWFGLQDGRFEERSPEGGVIRSAQFPGLWLAADALFPLDGGRVLDVLAEGMKTPEFAAYREGGKHA